MSFPLYSEYVETGLTWSPLVPKQWKLCALRHCLDSVFNGLSATQIDEGDETVPVTRIETISSGRIDLNKVGFIASSEAKERYLLRFGDVLFSNINSLNMIGHCAIYSGGVPIYAGMNLLVLRPSSDVEPRWLFWLLRSVGFRGVAESLAKPAINQASLPQSSLNGIRIMVPPKDEQIVIASFLDQETSKIDALISEQQRLIELLKEKRQAVISHAVTKGLNPDVPMKLSGVEWLGEVPEHWEVGPLGRLVVTKTGFAFDSEDFTEEGIPVLRIGDIRNDGSVDFSDAKYLPAEVLRERSDVLVELGDIVMAMTGATIGKASTYGYETPALLNQRVCRFRARNTKSQRFVYFSLLSHYYSEKVVITACGGAQPNISDQQLRRFRVAIPPLSEQLEIGDYISRKVESIDSLSLQAEKGISLLQERRTALISAAVTGKIDVRNYAATQKDAA